MRSGEATVVVEAAGTEEVEYFFKRGIAKWVVCLAMSLAEKIKGNNWHF
ncbi:hypothetical protein LXP68_002912 [Listeria innocua]|nr:hypothetical protein [Listeria monocytogenes]EIR8407079.1 hypothetical protein [Listeria innocua]EIR8410046.1 hypothetical protein [Listeria innocua]EIR8476548.1 hypothetical protein [Listeria innocua]EIT9487798.1 hypothetical protein [Listeria innocua]